MRDWKGQDVQINNTVIPANRIADFFVKKNPSKVKRLKDFAYEITFSIRAE